MQPNSLTRRGYKGKIYVKILEKKFMKDQKPTEKSDLDPKNIITDP